MSDDLEEQAESMAMDLIEEAFKAGIIQDLIVTVNVEGGEVVGGSCRADERKYKEENGGES